MFCRRDRKEILEKNKLRLLFLFYFFCKISTEAEYMQIFVIFSPRSTVLGKKYRSSYFGLFESFPVYRHFFLNRNDTLYLYFIVTSGDL